MNRMKPNVPWRSRRHPVFALVRADGRTAAWLAREVGYSPGHLHNVAAGFWPASDVLRARVASRLGRDEAELFDQGGTSSAGTHDGSDDRAGTAGSGMYRTVAGLSTLEEAPHTRSA